MRSYRDQRWLVNQDAQVTKMKAYVEALPAEWEWSWCLPFNYLCDAGQFLDLQNWMTRIGVKSWQFPWMHNVLQGRYYFPMEELRVLVDHVKPDVMLLEVPEHARAMRVVQQMAGQSFPIISMVEHVDFYEQTRVPEQVAYTLRQIDGALVSDCVAFPLEGMREEWGKAAVDLLSDRGQSALDDKNHFVTWNAIFSPKDVEAALDPDDLLEWYDTRDDKRVVVNFISRLSDNQRTHYVEFFQACEELATRGLQFQVWVANPNEGLPVKEIKNLCPNITKIGNAGRDEYLSDLWKSDIVPILYPQSHIYSLGFCEAVMSDNIVLTPTMDGDGMSAFFGPHEVRVTEETIRLGLGHMIGRLNDGMDRELLLEDQRAWVMKDRSVENNIDKVKATIEEVTR